MSAQVSPMNVSSNTAFPALSEMGINRFHEISHYTLNANAKNKDVLRVHYKRESGSLLPKSRKYIFGRSLQTVVVDGGSAKMDQVYEISPFLLKAISELDSLVTRKKPKAKRQVADSTRHAINAEMLNEINALEQWIHENLDARHVDEAAARISRIKSHIAA